MNAGRVPVINLFHLFNNLTMLYIFHHLVIFGQKSIKKKHKNQNFIEKSSQLSWFLCKPSLSASKLFHICFWLIYTKGNFYQKYFPQFITKLQSKVQTQANCSVSIIESYSLLKGHRKVDKLLSESLHTFPMTFIITFWH